MPPHEPAPGERMGSGFDDLESAFFAAGAALDAQNVDDAAWAPVPGRRALRRSERPLIWLAVGSVAALGLIVLWQNADTIASAAGRSAPAPAAPMAPAPQALAVATPPPPAPAAPTEVAPATPEAPAVAPAKAPAATKPAAAHRTARAIAYASPHRPSARTTAKRGRVSARGRARGR